ncbi:MAG: hypothetical protein R2713_23415 [Ilumatobacteraceae bacterium]
MSAAFDEINARAAAEARRRQFPPIDRLPGTTPSSPKPWRVMLDGDRDPFSSHPITTAWRGALAASRPTSTTARWWRVMIVGPRA